MPLQHFLPATFLASFSKDTNFPRRDRVLYAGNNKNGNIFSAKAKQLAVIKDLYTLKGPDEVAPLFIDEILSGYEPRLSKAIEQLINQDITALNWATVLVPFVVGLLVRGTDFNKRFHYRMSYIGLGVDTDNINYARWMEYQRLLAPIATAKWIVLNINSDDPMITNDYGYAPFINPSVGHYGVAIPIGLSNILVLVPIPKRIVAVAKGGTWDPQIDYSIEGFNNHIELNKVLASTANQFIFGPDSLTINKYIKFMKVNTRTPLEPGQMGFVNGYLAMVHDMDWFKLVSYLGKPPQVDGQQLLMNLLRKPKDSQPSS